MFYHIQIDKISKQPGDLLPFPPTEGQANHNGLYISTMHKTLNYYFSTLWQLLFFILFIVSFGF
jgi:hypothetical protein